MWQESADLRFIEMTEADIPALTAVMTRAFDNDAQKHQGRARGGPPGYDDGGFFREWVLGYEESVGYKVLLDDALVGCVIVWNMPDGHNFLGTVFVDPAYQDRGLGTRIWQWVETAYPDTKSWRLETPCWATKNHYFYEHKCGFDRVGEEGDSYQYRKDMDAQG
jgi:GNAT superfamily N-acetyltransferase